jgi:hypothetical protein
VLATVSARRRLNAVQPHRILTSCHLSSSIHLKSGDVRFDFFSERRSFPVDLLKEMESLNLITQPPENPLPCIKRIRVFHIAVFLVAALAIGAGIAYPFFLLFSAVVSPTISPLIPTPTPIPFFLNVNDIHLDPLYRPLSRVTDGSFCRNDTTTPIAAFPFGQYG